MHALYLSGEMEQSVFKIAGSSKASLNSFLFDEFAHGRSAPYLDFEPFNLFFLSLIDAADRLMAFCVSSQKVSARLGC